MAEADPASVFAPRFNALGAPWAATGAIASIIYGEIRTTLDIDIIILLDSGSVVALEQVFPDAEFYRPPRNVVEVERARDQGGHINLIHFDSGFKADVYVGIGDPLHGWAIRNRRLIDVDGIQLWLAPPEYVIVHKLEFYREGGGEKHLRDIRGMLAATEVERSLLEKEIAARGLQEAWGAVGKSS
ncbi:MAG TPA: hypothetical protein VJU77_12205 [Chthoniobacterales bacterium]|nr:hypothetical protein [Chthoniobacterales bacterium]